jgi:integrase
VTSHTRRANNRNTHGNVTNERAHRPIRTPTRPHTASADRSHTFAVNNLRSWFAHGEDVGALLPILQTYMGHSSLGDTAYYLRLTAASYPDITARVQQATGDVVPPIAAGPRHGH